MEEEFFGDPGSLLQLAGAPGQVSTGLWRIQQDLSSQVTGLVPGTWDGRAATAFKTHWDTKNAPKPEGGPRPAEAPAAAAEVATPYVYMPGSGQGAAQWAQPGGWVYDVRGVPTWDTNAALEGRVPAPGGGFGNNMWSGEGESAIPAQVPIENIARWGQVVEPPATGNLTVPNWITNPAFKGN